MSVTHPDDVEMTKEEYIEYLEGLVERLKERGATRGEIEILYGEELHKMGILF